LHVTASEKTTGINQTVEVRPSYGLTDEQVEQMLIDALDYGEQDLEARRLADARVEGERIKLATNKALASDGDLLGQDERDAIGQALERLEREIQGATDASSIQRASDALSDATHAFAGRRMNRAIQSALEGKSVGEMERRVEHAAGIDAHLAQKGVRS
jgi:molecular chaperone HscA